MSKPLRLRLTTLWLGTLLLFPSLGLCAETIPNYPCYRTVEGTFNTAQKIVQKYPHLATWIDVGDSWEKSVGRGGWDIMVLRLTNRFVPGPKPILFVTSAIHAREYATAELMTRFAEHLVAGYGTDPNLTWMLNYHEAQLLLILNPDGRKKAEPQVMWRKNTNQSYCGATSQNRGVDLNRNFDYNFGVAGSSSECSETYRGPSGGSEPETQAVQNYLRKIFPDKKPSSTTIVPSDYQGIYLDIHSYGEIIYQPTQTPNDIQLTRLNRKFAFFNGYRPILNERQMQEEREHCLRSPREFHGRNHTYSFGYGDLGVPSFLIELGTAFFQSCQSFESNILKKNIPVLEYALSVVGKPYESPAGPDITAITVTREGAQSVRIEATADDTRYGNKSGAETTQNIAQAELFVGTFPQTAGAKAQPLAAVDGQFDGAVEKLQATIDTSQLQSGRHLFYLRAKDVAGNWGPVRAVFVNLPL